LCPNGTLDNLVMNYWVENNFLGPRWCLDVPYPFFCHISRFVMDYPARFLVTLDKNIRISAFFSALDRAVSFHSVADHRRVVTFRLPRCVIFDVEVLLAILSLSSAKGTDSSQSSADGTIVVQVVAVQTLYVAFDFCFAKFKDAVFVEPFLFDGREIFNANVIHGMTIVVFEIILINLLDRIIDEKTMQYSIFFILVKPISLLPWILAPVCQSPTTVNLIPLC
jgi:hypothetical protein